MATAASRGFALKVMRSRIVVDTRAKWQRARLPSDAFDQRNQLPLDGLILDLGIGAKQPEAKRAIEEQQAFDLSGFAVAIVEERDRHIECGRSLLQSMCTNPVEPLLVLLNLLEADAQFFGEFGLRDFQLDPPKTDAPAEFDVGFPCGPWLGDSRRLHFFRHLITVLSIQFLTYGCTLPMASPVVKPIL